MKVPNTIELRSLEEEVIATGKGVLISGHEHWEDPHDFLTITMDVLRKHLEDMLGETIKILVLNVPGNVMQKEFICTIEEGNGGQGKQTLPKPYVPSMPSNYTIAV
jgi:hypothetical protein